MKRYEPTIKNVRTAYETVQDAAMRECSRGDYILHSDHLAALAEVERERDAARRECAAWREEQHADSFSIRRLINERNKAIDTHDTTAPNWQKEIQQ